MKKVSSKVIAAIVLLALISLSSFAMLSFSLADENNGASETKVFAETAKGYTQIDRIIENSNDPKYGDPVDENYYILEITSGDSTNPSHLETMVSSGNFMNNVFEGYKSITETMKAGTVKYECVSAKTDTATLLSKIQHADFIYLHNDPDALFSASNDLTEDVKLALSSFATADYKPFVIDSYNGTMSNKTQAYTYNVLINKVLKKYNAFSWNKEGGNYISNQDFLSPSSSKSTYLPVKSSNVSSSWTKMPTKDDVTRTDGSGKKYYSVAKVLSISKSGVKDLHDRLFNDLVDAGGAPTDLNDTDAANWATISTNLKKFYLDMPPEGSRTPFQKYGYYSYGEWPDYIKFETVTAADIATVSLNDYDFIVLESDLNNEPAVDEAVTSLSAAAMGNKHIIYSGDLKTSSSAGSISANPAPSYAYVLDKVATANDTSKFDNVLVTNFAMMKIYAGGSVSTVKPIADIIIYGSYRGVHSNSSGDDTSNVYTVLEIEPSYPIDTSLSKAFKTKETYKVTDPLYKYKTLSKTFFSEKYSGDNVIFDKYKQDNFYYLRTNSVLDDTTADEISFDDENPLSSYDGDETKIGDVLATVQTKNPEKLADYYRWTLSKAKIAHAVGLPYNQVKVVHMSSAEFNSSRIALSDGYDAIYIGGDTSGLKASDKWQNNSKYLMYFANGDTNTVISTSNGTYRSNDISNNKREELIKYNQTLPIIIDKTVKDAMTGDYGVDPKSNMYKVIKAVSSGPNTLYGFDSTQTLKIENSDKSYGDTYGGYVTVFNGDSEQYDYLGEPNTYATTGNHSFDEKALTTYLQKAQRPKITFTKIPKLYVETDQDTWITKDDFEWEYKVTGSSDISYQIIIDDNANGQFEDDAVRASGSGTEGKVNPKNQTDWIGDDFFGPVYWKFIATDTKTGASVSSTGISKIKRDPKKMEKMQVDLLEICPETSWADNGKNSLFLCTECQMCRTIANGNISAGDNQGLFGQQSSEFHVAGMKPRDPAYVSGTSTNMLKFGTNSITTYLTNDDSNYKYSDHGNTLGIHDHKFGICKYDDHEVRLGGKYVGFDNWRTNWFLDFENDYNVDTTLLSISEYESYCENVESVYENCKTDGKMDRDKVDAKKETYSQAATDYKKYYKCMVEVLNGTYNSAGNGLEAEDKAAFVKYLKETLKLGATVSGNNITYKTPTTDEDVTNMLNAFNKAAANCDSYLSANVSTIATNGKINCTEDEATKEINYLCDSSIKGDNKSYYLLYSLFSDGDEKVTPAFTPYYVVWRDAKILEQYLHYEYRENLIYSSVYYEEDADQSLIGKIDLTKAFSCIAVGAADNFADQDINELGCYSLLNYINKNGSVLLFHDTLTPSGVANNSGTPTMTRILGDAFGQGKVSDTSYPVPKNNNNNNNTTKPDSTVIQFNRPSDWGDVYDNVPNKNGDQVTITKDNEFTIEHLRPGSVTFYNYNGVTGIKYTCEGKTVTSTGQTAVVNVGSSGKVTVIYSDDPVQQEDETFVGYSMTQRSLQYKGKGSEHEKYYISQQNNNYFDYETETNNQSLHGSHDVRDTIYNNGYRTSSDKANQINEGVITEYPFTIDSTLTISPTISSGFTANVDEKEMVVYYTISGGSLGTASSMYTANKNDGANNYFLYQYGSVTYTGAGHSLITGVGRNNNDERRLFINVILNSARMSTAGPQLTLHDYESTDDIRTNNIIEEAYDGKDDTNNSVNMDDKEEYVTYVDSYDATPNFSFVPLASQGIKSVEIWYDVQNTGDKKNVYNYDATSTDPQDVLIYKIDESANLTNNHVINDKVKKISKDTAPKKLEDYKTNTDGSVVTALKLKKSHFTGNGNKCAYICVKLTDKKNKTVTKTIRVELKPELIDLN